MQTMLLICILNVIFDSKSLIPFESFDFKGYFKFLILFKSFHFKGYFFDV